MICGNCKKEVSYKSEDGLCNECFSLKLKGKLVNKNSGKTKFVEIVEEKKMFGLGKKNKEIKTMTIGCVKCGWKQEVRGTDDEVRKLRAEHNCEKFKSMKLEELPVPLPPVTEERQEKKVTINLDEDGYMQLPTIKENKRVFPVSEEGGDIPDVPDESDNQGRLYYLEQKLSTIEEILSLLRK